jgi:hypothetical protein
MRSVKVVMFLALVVLSCSTIYGQSCADYNYLDTYQPWDPSNNKGHLTGNHTFGTNQAATCTYTSVGEAYCASSCQAYGSGYGVDTGSTGVIYVHDLGAVVNGGGSSQGGGPEAINVQCGSTAAVTAVQCPTGFSCGTTIGFSGGEWGIGVSVSFPSGSIWGATLVQQETCPAEPDPTWGGGGCGGEDGTNDCGGGGGGGCDGDTCLCDDGTCSHICCTDIRRNRRASTNDDRRLLNLRTTIQRDGVGPF